MAFQGNAFQKNAFQTDAAPVADDPSGQADMILLIPQDPSSSYFQRRVFAPQEAAVVADAVLRRREMPPASWWDEPQPSVFARALSPGIPGQSVDNPPPLKQPDFSRWFADPEPVIRAKQLSPGIPGQSVDNPPPLKQPDFSQFFREPDPVVVARNLSPGIPGQAVDQPPRWRAQDFSRWFLPSDPIIERRPLSPGVPGQSIDAPPPRRTDVSWASFALPDPAPQLPRRLVPIAAAAPTDEPPYGVPSKSLSIIESAWIASLEFLPSQRGQRTILEPDPPPGPPAMGIPYWMDDWPSQRARTYPQALVVTADDPPFGIPSKSLSGILWAWQSEPPYRVGPRPLSPSLEAVQVDNPPGVRPTLPMAVTVTWWEPLPPFRFPPPKQTVDGPAPPAVTDKLQDFPYFANMGRLLQR